MLLDGNLFYAIASAALYWAALPPLGLSWLSLLVPVCWAQMIKPPLSRSASAEGRNIYVPVNAWRVQWSGGAVFYFKIWLAGALFWLAVLSWSSSFAAWWTKVLWVSFSFALAVFWVLFILVSRVAVNQLRLPVIVAVPLAWCGVEYVRKNYPFGGFAFGALEHTLYRSSLPIQIADLSGEYGVGALIVFTGACIADIWVGRPSVRRLSTWLSDVMGFNRRALRGCVVVWALVIVYGQSRLVGERARADQASPLRNIKVALIQGDFENTPDTSSDERWIGFEYYKTVSRRAAAKADLVVWPEASCPLCLIDLDHGFVPDGSEAQPVETIAKELEVRRESREQFVGLARESRADLLIGLVTKMLRNGKAPMRFTSALHVDPGGGLFERYDKVHLVPFVEYNPMACCVPSSSESFTAGQRSPAFPLVARNGAVSSDCALTRGNRGPLYAAVNICFDGSCSHLVRQQVVSLRREGRAPDLIINLSNGGTKRARSMSEMQLATHVFRAVENRCQYLSAANCGIAAWIESDGRIVREGTSSETYIIADVHAGSGRTMYQVWGDALAASCALFDLFVLCYFAATAAFAARSRRRRRLSR